MIHVSVGPLIGRKGFGFIGHDVCNTVETSCTKRFHGFYEITAGLVKCVILYCHVYVDRYQVTVTDVFQGIRIVYVYTKQRRSGGSSDVVKKRRERRRVRAVVTFVDVANGIQ